MGGAPHSILALDQWANRNDLDMRASALHGLPPTFWLMLDPGSETRVW